MHVQGFSTSSLSYTGCSLQLFHIAEMQSFSSEQEEQDDSVEDIVGICIPTGYSMWSS